MDTKQHPAPNMAAAMTGQSHISCPQRQQVTALGCAIHIGPMRGRYLNAGNNMRVRLAPRLLGNFRQSFQLEALTVARSFRLQLGLTPVNNPHATPLR